MQYKKFKNEINLSRLGLGIMRLPVLDAQPEQPIDYEKAKKIVDLAVESGVNYFDTAYIYHNGKAEAFIGKALAEYPRNSYFIADKFNYQAQPDYRIQFAEQLERLQTDYIDFYLLHGIQDNFADDILNCGCIEYFDQLKKEGKIRYFGFSFHGNEENLKKILALYSWDFVQIQLNYYDWEFGNERQLYEILLEEKLPIMIMEPVHGGLLAKLNEEAAAVLKQADQEASLASWAMRWIKSMDNVYVVLSGMSDTEQVSDNVATFSERLNVTEEERELLKKAANLLRPDVSVPCTKCCYCVPNCPQGLNIPWLLEGYNEARAGQPWLTKNLNGLAEEKRPSACIGCGACTEHCPQALPIPGIMEKLAEMLKE